MYSLGNTLINKEKNVPCPLKNRYIFYSDRYIGLIVAILAVSRENLSDYIFIFYLPILTEKY